MPLQCTGVGDAIEDVEDGCDDVSASLSRDTPVASADARDAFSCLTNFLESSARLCRLSAGFACSQNCASFKRLERLRRDGSSRTVCLESSILLPIFAKILACH